MPGKVHTVDGPVLHRDTTVDTVVKSSLSGVAATVLAVTIWSPAGLGGMVGTSMASGTGAAPTADTPDLAAYPAPLTSVELADIRAKLTSSAEAIDTLRAATDREIDHIRSIAAHSGLGAAPMSQIAQASADAEPLRLRTALVDDVAPLAAAPVSVTPVAVSYEAPDARLSATSPAVTYSGGGDDYAARDPNMELAALLFAL